MTGFLQFLRDERGATLIEYGLIVSCIAIAIVGTITALGGQLSTNFTNTTASLGR